MQTPDRLPVTEGANPEPSFFEEVTDYIGFGAEDSVRLREFLPRAEAHLPRVAEHFYERIFSHPRADQVISGGQEQVDRLKRTLVEWMRSGLAGPHDYDYCLRRSRIGHVHVRIGLPQRYMVTAMNGMRVDFREVIDEHCRNLYDATEREALIVSLERLFDLDLAIMLETYKLAADERLRRRERLATIGQLAASIGHDLRNPLSVVQSSLYILRRRVAEDPRSSKHIEKIANQVDECDAIITRLLEMARNRPPQRSLVTARELFETSLAAAAVPERIRVDDGAVEELQLFVDAGLFKQALVNLLINAVQAQEGAGIITLTARANPDGSALMRVADGGPGFGTETLPAIFEPLVTTKASGTGLGLALVKSIIERHGGQATAGNVDEGGAAVTLHLSSVSVPTAPAPP